MIDLANNVVYRQNEAQDRRYKWWDEYSLIIDNRFFGLLDQNIEKKLWAARL